MDPEDCEHDELKQVDDFWGGDAYYHIFVCKECGTPFEEPYTSEGLKGPDETKSDLSEYDERN